MELLSGCECDGEVGCSAADCTAKGLRRPWFMTPAAWREVQARELRAMIRRVLGPGAVDPFEGR